MLTHSTLKAHVHVCSVAVSNNLKSTSPQYLFSLLCLLSEQLVQCEKNIHLMYNHEYTEITVLEQYLTYLFLLC